MSNQILFYVFGAQSEKLEKKITKIKEKKEPLQLSLVKVDVYQLSCSSDWEYGLCPSAELRAENTATS